MTRELEGRLVALGAALEIPPPPDLAPDVLARLPARPRRQQRPAARAIAVAAAALLLLAGAAMAAPPTRHAILRIFGLRGVRIERVLHLPPVPAGARLGLGRQIPLAQARHAAGFTALLPPGSPVAYLGHDVPGGRISLLTGRLLIIELRGTSTSFIVKVVEPGTTVTPVRVSGGPGYYLSGAPHEVYFPNATGGLQPDRIRLAGNVLIWDQGRVTIRVEGTHALTQALALARSLR